MNKSQLSLAALRLLCGVVTGICLLGSQAALASEPICPVSAPPEGVRTLVVISDLHLGLGRTASGAWDPREDFRWSDALNAFLERVSACTDDRADLVVAGDLLELWQPPVDVACRGPNGDLGCTPAELLKTTQAVIAAHRTELAALGRLAARGDNRLVLLPGNHDAALMLPDVWDALSTAVGAPPSRLVRADAGHWLWDSGRVLIEHGHQIGSDVNRYDAWPRVLHEFGGQSYMARPWGERFVQKLFNEQEDQYPVIDNLSPETAGARYRMADRGLAASAGDLARFLAFNLFETSLSQKTRFLGASPDPSAPPPPWDLPLARSLGHKLFVAALSDDDPFRARLLAEGDEGKTLREAIDAMAADALQVPDDEVNALCDLAAARRSGGLRCERQTLGSAVEKLLHSRRSVLAKHLRQRLAQAGLESTRMFIYGHTHELETPWPVQATSMREVTVANSGAFQRVVDEKGFLARARARDWTPAQALRQMSVSDLPACYTAILVRAAGAQPKAVVTRWHHPEGGAGRFVSVNDAACR